MKALFDRTALSFFQILPLSLARHLLFLLRNNSAITDRWGYYIRPIHYYEPLPDFCAISEAQIRRRRENPAIDFNWNEQLRLMSELEAGYRDELKELAVLKEPKGFDFENDYFAAFDAAVYYALIRYLKPANVIEVGSGNSTRIAEKALRCNRQQGQPGRLICIEPYPQPRLTQASSAFELIEKRVEDLDLKFFSQLQPNDILFIDSSHTVKFNSDVCYEFLEILPSLKPGVWVHVHDIFFPHDYPAEWLLQKRIAFSEQYLLEAFLSFNHDFVIALSNYWLCLDYLQVVKRLWPSATSQPSISISGNSSFWFYKCKQGT